jgi:hypothetical protein
MRNHAQIIVKTVSMITATSIFLLACHREASYLKAPLERQTTTRIRVINKEFDFGRIQRTDSAVHTFQILNIGPRPLRIESAQSSCGCTTPFWSKLPIKAGDTAFIKVVYKPMKSSEGVVKKSVIFKANNSSLFGTLYITGTVLKNK